TLLHLWQGQSPYAGMSEMQIIAHTLDGKILIPDDMPSDLKMLVRGLTAYDKKKRLTYDDVSKWCKGFDISDRIDMGSEFKRRYLTNREYNFKGEIVESINDLSVVATRSMDLWDEAKKRFSSGLLDE
ncbi:protein kinase, partial [Aduncisulcus paluster]